MAQVQTPPTAISPEAQQAASMYPIGRPLAEHKVGYGTSNIICAAVAGGFAGLLFLLIGLSNLRQGFFFLLIGLVFIAVGAMPALAPVLFKNRKLIVGTEGLVRIKGNKADVIRWDQIASVRRYIMRYYFFLMQITTTHSYVVQRSDGKKFTFTDLFSNIEAFGNHVETMVNQYHLPQAIAAFNAGNGVPFDTPFKKLTVSPQGLYRGNKLIPWNEITNIQLKTVRIGGYSFGLLGVLLSRFIGPYSMEYVVIERQGLLNSNISILTSRFQNVSVFLGLIKHASGGRL